nr:MAG TPA: hypothetical protein [Caudoviricetes sp.]
MRHGANKRRSRAARHSPLLLRFYVWMQEMTARTAGERRGGLIPPICTNTRHPVGGSGRMA